MLAPLTSTAAQVSGTALSMLPGSSASLTSSLNGAGGPVAGVSQVLDASTSSTLQLPQTLTGGVQTVFTTVHPAAIVAGPRSLPRGISGAGQSLRPSIRRASLQRGLHGYQSTLTLTSQYRGAGSQYRGAGARDHKTPRRLVRKLWSGTGPASQTDSTTSGGGAGAAQAAAQVPASAGNWNPAGRFVRIETSRWPATRLLTDEPAVSPD
jgi:hypothetical protein